MLSFPVEDTGGIAGGLWMVHGESAVWEWGYPVMFCLAMHPELSLLTWMPGTLGLLPSPGPCLIFSAHSSPPTQGCLLRSNTVALKTEILHALILLLYLFRLPLECPSSIAFLTLPVSLNPLYIHTLSYLWWLIWTLEDCLLLVPWIQSTSTLLCHPGSCSTFFSNEV